MRRLRTWLLIGAAAVALGAAAVVLALPRLIDTPRVQGLIAQNIAHALGRPARFAAVKVSVLPLPSIVVRDLEVAEDPAFGPRPFLRLEEAEVRLRLLPLLTFRVQLGDFILKRPVISLVQAADGRWNFATLGAGGEARAPGRARGGAPAAGAVLGSRVRIADGVLTYETRTGGATARYRVESLDLTLTPGPGPLAFAGDATVKPGDLEIRITDGSVALDGARRLADAPVRATVAIAGRNVRDLVAFALGPEPVIAGGIRGTLAVGGTVAEPRATGDITLSDLAVTRTQPQCPEPRRRTLALGAVEARAAWADGRLESRPLRAGLAGGEVTTNVTVTLDRGLRVQLADLAVRRLPVGKVLVDFLCQGYAVTGPLELTGQASARLGDLWRTLDGRGQVRIGPGQVVGSQALALLGGIARVGGAVSTLLTAELPPGLFSSPLDFDAITASYTIDAGVVTTRDFRYTSRSLTMTAAGTYALATGAMNLDVVLSHGRGQLNARITGTAANPSIRVLPGGVLKPPEPGAVERGLQDLLRRFR